MKKLNRKGFTLVELLAVVVVLAIVAAIAMRSITGIIKNNRIDSFAASINTAIEGAEMTCMGTQSLAGIQDTIDAKALRNITVTDKSSAGVVNEDGSVSDATYAFEVAAVATGEYKTLNGGDASSPKDSTRIKAGVKGVSADNISCSGQPVKCIITFNECTSY